MQEPHPPILVGGNSDGALDRAVALADEWIPNPETRLSRLGERISELGRRAAEAGREPLPITFYGVKPEHEALVRYGEAGVGRAVLLLPSGSREQVEPLLDNYASLVDEQPGG